MSNVAIVIIITGLCICWSLDEIARAISKNKEDEK